VPFYVSNDDYQGFQADQWAQSAHGRVADQWATQAQANAPDLAAQAEQAAAQQAQARQQALDASQQQAQQYAQQQAADAQRQAAQQAAEQQAQQAAANTQAANQWSSQAYNNAATAATGIAPAPTPPPTPASQPQPQVNVNAASQTTAAPTPAPAPADQTAAAVTPSSPLPSVSSGNYVAYAWQAAQKAGIDPNIFTRQIQQESGFQPFNADGSPKTSPAGAVGIAQIVPKYHPGVDATNPLASLDYAAQYMAGLVKQNGGDYGKALAAYNAGQGAVDRFGGVPPFAETQTYVKNILGDVGGMGAQLAQQAQQGLGALGQTAANTGAAALRLVGGAVNNVVENLRPSQFGVGLDDATAYAACGPVAAIAFARAMGRNPTAQEAVALAKQVGWSPGQGMAGPGSEMQLLTSMGVPAHMEQGADPTKIAADVQNGNPVIISTPGHYFVADGYDPQSGAFHVGSSGTDLKRGSEWMTLGQMQQVMGSAQATLYLDRKPGDGPSVAAAVRGGQTYMSAMQPAGQPSQPQPRSVMGFINQTQSAQGRMPTDEELGNFVLSQPPQQPAALAPAQPQPTSPFDVVGQTMAGLGGGIQNVLGGVTSGLQSLLGGGGGPVGQPPQGPAETAPAQPAGPFAGLPQLPTGVVPEGGGYGAGGPLQLGEAGQALAPIGTAVTNLAQSPYLPTTLQTSALQAIGQSEPVQKALAWKAQYFPSVLDPGHPVNVAVDLENKYGTWLPDDKMTPEDRSRADSLMFAFGGMEMPSMPEGMAAGRAAGEAGGTAAERAAAEAAPGGVGPLERFGLTDRPAEGQAPLADEDLLSHFNGLQQRYEANDVQIARLEDQLHEARNPGVAPIRPQWAVGLPNETVVKIANDHGVSPYQEDWWEEAGLSKGSQEVSRLLSEGGYRGVGTARLGGSQLARAQTELDRLKSENASIMDHVDQLTSADPGTLYRAPAAPAELPFAPPANVVEPAAREPVTPTVPTPISPPAVVAAGERVAPATPESVAAGISPPSPVTEPPAAATVGGAGGLPPIEPPTAVGPPPPPPEPEPGLLNRLTQGQPEQAGNITLSKYPEDVRQVITDAANFLPDQMKAATRGVLPDQAVRDLSQQTGIDVGQIVRNWNPGQAQNAETLLALRDALTAQARKVIDAQQALRANPDDVAAQGQLLQELTQHAAIQEVVSGTTAEAGRALRQFRQGAPGSDFAANQINQMAARSGMTPVEMAQALGRVDLSDPAAVSQLARSLPQGPPTLAEIFKTYHTNNVISGLPTLTHVAVNSILAPAWSFTTRSLADIAGLNFDRVQGGGIGLGAGLAHAADDFLAGFSNVWNNPASVANRLGGVGGAALRAQGVFGALHGAFQNVAQGIIERTEVGRLAGEAASDQGLKGVDWTKFVADALDNPSADMLQQARGVAERAALRGDLGTLGTKMQQIASVPFIGNTLFPVVKISTNALTQGIERSPLGLLGTAFDVARAARGAGPYARGFEPFTGAVTPLSERLTNNLAGTAVTALLVNKALDGTITGDGPSDPKERAALTSQGWQSNSIWIPGRGYVDYRVLGPIAQDFALAGNYADAVHEAQKHPGDPTLGQNPLDIAGNLAQRQASYMSDATGLRTLGQMYEVLHGGANAANVAAQFGGQLAGGFVPESALVRGLVSAADPYARQPQRGDIGEVIAQGLPGGTPITGGRTDLPVRLNEMGQPEVNPQAGLGVFVPRTGTGQVSPVMTLLGSVGLSPPSAPKSVRVGAQDITLSTDEQRQYQQLRGALLEQMMTPLTQNEQFAQAPGPARKQVLQRLVSQADQVAQRQLIGTIAQTGDLASRLGPGVRQQEPTPFRPPMPLTEMAPLTSASQTPARTAPPLTSDLATLSPMQQEQLREQMVGTP
jgi:soluble lytic murein transglycosylase-like protein